MIDLKMYCEHLYNSTYIPIYLYDNEELTASYPVQEKGTLPPPPYLKRLWDIDKIISYTQTQFNSFYGCIRIDNSSYCIVIGPINDFSYSDESLLVMSKEYCIEHFDMNAFSNFFNNIPTVNPDTFFNLLLFINYTLNQTQIDKKDLFDYVDILIDIPINQKYSEQSYSTKEEGIMNNNYSIENELLRYIETGNLIELGKFTEHYRNLEIGILASDTLRQYKNTCIITVTLISRAAMKGGLSPSISYLLSNTYIKQAELLTDIDAIITLMIQVQFDFATRVANSLSPVPTDNTLYQVIQFVRENTNKKLSAADVANHVGFNSSYLSRKVKKELGFNLSDFIMQCKLEEAKDLLAYSDKSLSQISNYLYFSSQSHFQKAFKDKYEITPQAYRNSIIQNKIF